MKIGLAPTLAALALAALAGACDPAGGTLHVPGDASLAAPPVGPGAGAADAGPDGAAGVGGGAEDGAAGADPGGAPADGAPADGAASADGGGGGDAGGPLAGTGEACSADEDCAAQWCLPTPGGAVCTQTCDAPCPAGWACQPAKVTTSDVAYICVPGDTRLCLPCASDDACGSGLCLTFDDGAACTVACGGDAPCPTGFTCEPRQSESGAGDATPQCVPVAGSCSATGVVVVEPPPEPEPAGPGPGDADGDGIPDDEDLLPCLAVYLEVSNQGVTSASVELNGAEVVGSSAFPTTDVITVWINPAPGENTLALGGKVGGSPKDSLRLRVADTGGTVYLDEIIVRKAGPPAPVSLAFTLPDACSD